MWLVLAIGVDLGIFFVPIVELVVPKVLMMDFLLVRAPREWNFLPLKPKETVLTSLQHDVNAGLIKQK